METQSIGTTYMSLMKIIYFANVSSGSSQGKSPLDTDESQFSDSRTLSFLIFSFVPNTIQIVSFHRFIVDDPGQTNEVLC